jgi:hypothetical protein
MDTLDSSSAYCFWLGTGHAWCACRLQINLGMHAQRYRSLAMLRLQEGRLQRSLLDEVLVV